MATNTLKFWLRQKSRRGEKQLRNGSKSKLHTSSSGPHLSKYIFQSGSSYFRAQVLCARPKCPATGVSRERDFGQTCSGNSCQPESAFQVWIVMFPKCSTEMRFCYQKVLLGAWGKKCSRRVNFTRIWFQQGVCFSPCFPIPRGKRESLQQAWPCVARDGATCACVSLCPCPNQTRPFLSPVRQGMRELCPALLRDAGAPSCAPRPAGTHGNGLSPETYLSGR